MTQTTEKVAPTAIDTTRTAHFSFKAQPRNGFTRTIIAHSSMIRYGAVLLLILGGYGFGSASNFITAFVCAGLGLVMAEGPETFYRFLNHLRATADAALDGIEPDGSYVGDGVPRDQGGHPFEPLDWPEGLVRI
ncbi:hypothetical protein [Bifidobacterium subtile]|jgi:hypothetical protein|uniref:hypothetical protein n=1 Tax=Bifidobacterium subtile TaxID=77635 RepID=UPI002F35FE92